MRDVPWDQALDVILRANKLGYVLDGTIVRVAPLAVLAEEEKQRRKLAEEQALSGELRVSTRALNYAQGGRSRAPGDQERADGTRHGAGRRADEHPRPLGPAARHRSGAGDRYCARRSAAPGRDRGAHRPDLARLRAHDWRAVGARAAAWPPELGNTTPLAFPNSGSLTGRTGRAPGPSATPTAVDLGIATGTIRRRPCARRGERRVQPRRRADRARARGARPAALDAAGRHAEQRRSRDHAGRPDSRFRRSPTTRSRSRSRTRRSRSR